MSRSGGITRRETLLVGVGAAVLAAGLGIGGYALYRSAEDERVRQHREASRINVPEGEKVEIEDDGFCWDGTLGVTLLGGVCYNSLADARQAVDLGSVSEYDLKDGICVVCDMVLDGKEAHAKFVKDNVLNVSFFQLLYPDGETMTAPISVWSSGGSADDEMAGMYGIRFNEGDELTVRLGFTLPDGTNPEGSRLACVSEPYHFLLDFKE